MLQTESTLLILIPALTNYCHAQAAIEASAQEPLPPPKMDILAPRDWDRIDQSADAAIAWLAASQQSDGSFPTNQLGQPGVTALCLLAFTARGHLPSDEQYGTHVVAAIKYIIGCQKRSGLISSTGPAGQFNPQAIDHNIATRGAYNHAIGSLALTEAYGMTEADLAKQIANCMPKSIEFSLRLQRLPKRDPRTRGGWRYLDNVKQPPSDLSVTGWYLMSMRSAKNAGFDIPDQSIDDAVQYVRGCFDRREGVFHYGKHDSLDENFSRGMAAAGILALAHAGEHNSTEALASGNWLLRRPFPAYNRVANRRDRYHYAAFYSCQAFYQLGGKFWSQGFPRIAQQLVAARLASS
jgi:hypothetical protein